MSGPEVEAGAPEPVVAEAKDKAATVDEKKTEEQTGEVAQPVTEAVAAAEGAAGEAQPAETTSNGGSQDASTAEAVDPIVEPAADGGAKQNEEANTEAEAKAAEEIAIQQAAEEEELEELDAASAESHASAVNIDRSRMMKKLVDKMKGKGRKRIKLQKLIHKMHEIESKHLIEDSQYVNPAKLRTALQKANLLLDSDDIDKLVEVTRTAEGDSCDFNEFIEFMAGEDLRIRSVKKLLQGLRKQLQIPSSKKNDFDTIFKAMDENGDGVLSLQELENAVESLDLGWGAETVKQLVSSLDVDGDGELDLNEFIELVTGHAPVVLFPPAGCVAVDLMDATLNRWGMKWGTRIGENVEFKEVLKADILEEIEKMGASNDLFKQKSILEKELSYTDQVLFIKADPNDQDMNYVIAVKRYAYNAFHAKLVEEERRKADEEEEAKRKKMESEKLPPFEDKPYLVPREWPETGVSEEMKAYDVASTRPLLGFHIDQQRRHFGKHVEFTDFEMEKPPEYRKQKIPNFETGRMEKDYGFQAKAATDTIATQTHYALQRNKICQYEPQHLPEEEQNKLLKSEELQGFISSVEPFIAKVLTNNETLDLFKDELKQFDSEEGSLGNRTESNLKELHSFTDLKYSKNRIISCIDWHPTQTGVVAFACANNYSFDQWVDVSGKVLTSSILIWNFQDLLHPQYILDVPGDLLCFRFNPDNPDVVVGGLSTGQVVFFDLSKSLASSDTDTGLASSSDSISSSLSSNNRSNFSSSGSGAATSKAPLSNVIKPTLVSFLDKSHASMISDIRWLPRKLELNKKGEATELPDQQAPFQFVTMANDGQIMFWDTRLNRFHLSPNEMPKAGEDPRWQPFYKYTVMRKDNIGVMNLTKLCLGTSTNLVALTEDGEVIWLDYNTKKEDGERSSNKGSVNRIVNGHFFSCRHVAQSPHFEDVFLTVGDWTFTIWKADQAEPVFKSPMAENYITDGRWSPSRPGVIVTARADGAIEVWDLLDQGHKPAFVFPVGNDKITSIQFWQSENGASQHLAVGDNGGKLHVIDVPRTIRKATNNEKVLMKAFYDREIKRSHYAIGRREIRRREKRDQLTQKDKAKKSDAADSAEDNSHEKKVTINEGGSTHDANEDSANAKRRAREEAELEVRESSYQKMLEEYRKSHAQWIKPQE